MLFVIPIGLCYRDQRAFGREADGCKVRREVYQNSDRRKSDFFCILVSSAAIEISKPRSMSMNWLLKPSAPLRIILLLVGYTGVFVLSRYMAYQLRFDFDVPRSE